MAAITPPSSYSPDRVVTVAIGMLARYSRPAVAIEMARSYAADFGPYGQWGPNPAAESFWDLVVDELQKRSQSCRP